MTVERAALVEFWPLVDIGRLDLCTTATPWC